MYYILSLNNLKVCYHLDFITPFNLKLKLKRISADLPHTCTYIVNVTQVEIEL